MEDITVKIKKDIENDPFLSVTEICKKYQISYYEWKKLGIEFTNKLHPTQKSLEILQKLKEGKSLSELAREYGVTRQAIYDIKKKYMGVI